MYIQFAEHQKINTKILRPELEAVQSNVEFEIIEQVLWMNFPFTIESLPPHIIDIPDDLDAPYLQKAVCHIENGEEVNKVAFEAVIAAHAPAMTNIEEQQLAQQQEQAKQLVEALMALPDEQLIPIKQRFDNLIMP